MSRRRRLVGVVAAIAATVVLIVVAAVVLTRVLAQPEDPDAFYEPPTPLPAGPPGTLVRSESIDALAGRAWRVLYLSTGLDGAPIAVSGIVVAPEGQPPPGGWPVAAWAHGTSGIASRCAPSLFDEHGQDRIPELAALVDSGVVVVAPTTPGLGTPGPHPYLVGQSEGRAVLDAARAASTLLPGEASRTTAVYGPSEGGHVSLSPPSPPPTMRPSSTSSASRPWRRRQHSAICSMTTSARSMASSSRRSPWRRGRRPSRRPPSQRSSTRWPAPSSPTSLICAS